MRVLRPARHDTPTDTAGVERALERAQAAVHSASAAAAVTSGRWTHVERIMDRVERIRSRSDFADDIRTVLGDPTR